MPRRSVFKKTCEGRQNSVRKPRGSKVPTGNPIQSGSVKSHHPERQGQMRESRYGSCARSSTTSSSDDSAGTLDSEAEEEKKGEECGICSINFNQSSSMDWAQCISCFL